MSTVSTAHIAGYNFDSGKDEVNVDTSFMKRRICTWLRRRIEIDPGRACVSYPIL